MSYIPKCQCFGSYFSEANVRNPILAKSLVSSPIIAIFSGLGEARGGFDGGQRCECIFLRFTRSILLFFLLSQRGCFFWDCQQENKILGLITYFIETHRMKFFRIPSNSIPLSLLPISTKLIIFNIIKTSIKLH